MRSVAGWNLGPGGAFVVTLRLTERELLGGRDRWVEDIAPDARRERYGVRFDIEAPDGTLVAGGPRDRSTWPDGQRRFVSIR